MRTLIEKYIKTIKAHYLTFSESEGDSQSQLLIK